MDPASSGLSKLLHAELDKFLEEPTTEKYDIDTIRAYFAFKREKRTVQNILPVDEMDERLAIAQHFVDAFRAPPGAENTNLTAIQVSVILLMPLDELCLMRNIRGIDELEWKLNVVPDLSVLLKSSQSQKKSHASGSVTTDSVPPDNAATTGKGHGIEAVKMIPSKRKKTGRDGEYHPCSEPRKGMFAFKCLGITPGAGSTYKVHLQFRWMPRTLLLDNRREPSRQTNLDEDDGRKMVDALSAHYGDPEIQPETHGVVSVIRGASSRHVLSGDMFEVELEGKEEAEKMKMMLDFQWNMIVVIAAIAGGTRGTGRPRSPEPLEDITDPDNEDMVHGWLAGAGSLRRAMRH